MLEVRTGCRIHFGLMELASDQPLLFGGLGLMLNSPDLIIRVSPVGTGAITGLVDADSEHASRVEKVLRANNAERFDVHFDAIQPLHSGLGGGTQLAASVAAAIQLAQSNSPDSPRYSEWTPVREALPELTPSQLSQLSNRGLRSAVGLHGFLQGGLILDEGYEASVSVETGQQNEISSASTGRRIKASSVQLPSDIQVVLVRPKVELSVSGDEEAQRLSALGRTPNPKRAEMFDLASRLLEQSSEIASESCFLKVMSQLEQYMQFAAEMFADDQGGLYNGPSVAEAVQLCRNAGLRGVGQSSWGPTVFGFTNQRESAENAIEQLCQFYDTAQITHSVPDNQGATFRYR